MASRAGQRAGGTDGRDYAHREKVAPHYQKSAQLKKNVKYMIAIQLLAALYTLIVVIIVRDVPSIITLIGYAAGLPSGWISLKRNSGHLINAYGVCCSLFGIFPMSYVIYSSFWTHGIPSYLWLRLSQAVGVILVNGVASYFAKELMTLWYASVKRKN